MNSQLECKKQILDHLIRDFRLDGDLPDIQLLKSCIQQLHPAELAQSIYFLECASPDEDEVWEEQDENKYQVSIEVKNSVQKIFLALAKHFENNPVETESAMDDMMKYLSSALHVTLLKYNILSVN